MRARLPLPRGIERLLRRVYRARRCAFAVAGDVISTARTVIGIRSEQKMRVRAVRYAMIALLIMRAAMLRGRRCL